MLNRRVGKYIGFIFLLVGFSVLSFTETQNSLLQALRSGNAKEVSKLFSSNVSLTIKSETNYYSKFQAEMVLQDFFGANKPQEVKQLQRISNTDSNYYIIYQFKTSSQTFRVFVRFVDAAGNHQISELRIE